MEGKKWDNFAILKEGSHLGRGVQRDAAIEGASTVPSGLQLVSLFPSFLPPAESLTLCFLCTPQIYLISHFKYFSQALCLFSPQTRSELALYSLQAESRQVLSSPVKCPTAREVSEHQLRVLRALQKGRIPPSEKKLSKQISPNISSQHRLADASLLALQLP